MKTKSLVLLFFALVLCAVAAWAQDDFASNWRAEDQKVGQSGKDNSRFFALRGRRSSMNHLLRGKRSLEGFKRDQFDHLLRGRRSDRVNHFLRGRRAGDQLNHFLRGRKNDDFHRILRSQVNHFLRGKKSGNDLDLDLDMLYQPDQLEDEMIQDPGFY